MQLRSRMKRQVAVKNVKKLNLKSEIFARTSATARDGHSPNEPGRQLRRTCYLRAAQAYMLISMPTGTSTTFGVFQAIRGSSQVHWSNVGACLRRLQG